MQHLVRLKVLLAHKTNILIHPYKIFHLHILLKQ
jgi:hypothetical protein